MLYPRDPTLDPQLVWKGKDEQDARRPRGAGRPDLHPGEDRTRGPSSRTCAETATAGEPEPRADALRRLQRPRRSSELVDFYHHERQVVEPADPRRLAARDDQPRREGGPQGQGPDDLLDPPYGIKFGSNWQVSTRKRDVKDGKVDDVTRQPEQIRAFRDTWELGIHSYLAYLRDRLVVARELLTESGSIFVQIGDENVHLVRSLLDEVFGSENFVSLITFKKTSGAGSFAGGPRARRGLRLHPLVRARRVDT